jgi:hypothetical protein
MVVAKKLEDTQVSNMVYNFTIVQQSGKCFTDFNGEIFESNLLKLTTMIHD